MNTSTNNSNTIRNKLYDFIRVADDKKLYAIYNLLENEIEETNEWWKDKQFVEELDKRYKALEILSEAEGPFRRTLLLSLMQLRFSFV